MDSKINMKDLDQMIADMTVDTSGVESGITGPDESSGILGTTKLTEIDDLTTNLNDSDEVADEESVDKIERPDSFDNARLKDELWDDYKARRIQMKKWARQHKFRQSHGEDNRKQRRERNPIRLTDKLRKVRKKWMYGRYNVTYAIQHDIPLNHYVRVAKMGLKHKDLIELGKEYETMLKKEQPNGADTN